MDELAFFRKMGLKANPFQYTNADEEDSLQDYFVPPPYFQSVWGNPKKPSSCVIFAPRGGGKSAQRKMIEIRSIGSAVLALQYSRFEFERGQNLTDIDLIYHLRNIIRICLIGLLMQIYEKDLNHTSFSSTERHQIMELCKFYLQDMNPDQVINAAKSIMSSFDKAKEFFKRNLWSINSILNSLFSKIGLSAINTSEKDGVRGISKPSKNHLEIVVSIIKQLGFDSIYILIDKVDETQLTGNDAKASYELIEPILRDLELLQTKNVAFKFFLWNEIYPFYEKWARPDRISQYNLKWKVDELKEMMKLRLQTYKTNGAPYFYDLLNPDMSAGVKKAIEYLLFTFCHGSPRDMIRICQQMSVEQLRRDQYLGRIGFEAVTEGFNVFCGDRAKEVVPEDILRELQKTHRLDFTVNFVANEVFKIGTNGARAKIKTWLNTGIVKHIDDIRQSGSKKPVYHYAVTDSRVAKFIFSEIDFVNFLGKKIRTCIKCGANMLRDWDLSGKHICQECKTRFGP